MGAGALYWAAAHLLPNGDLLTVIVRSWTPYGYKIVKLNADSELLWQQAIPAHHDISVDGEGRINTLAQRIRDVPLQG